MTREKDNYNLDLYLILFNVQFLTLDKSSDSIFRPITFITLREKSLKGQSTRLKESCEGNVNFDYDVNIAFFG